jgi:hypothetical protein
MHVVRIFPTASARDLSYCARGLAAVFVAAGRREIHRGPTACKLLRNRRSEVAEHREDVVVIDRCHTFGASGYRDKRELLCDFANGLVKRRK